MKKELWVDYVKVFACTLVVLGHFFQSMIKASILPANDLYNWFNTTIYYFHVPLFFICSGYLYQRYSKVVSVKTWGNNVLRKFIALGIPFFIFSTVTWMLKTIFSSSVNDEIDSLFTIWFVKPTSPYWYLYVLFFIFVITITFKSDKQMYIVLFAAVGFKLMISFGLCTNIYLIDQLMRNEIWFVIGMVMAHKQVCAILNEQNKKRIFFVGLFAWVWFLGLSIVVNQMQIGNGRVDFLMAILACFAVILLFVSITFEDKKYWIFSKLSMYTMPIFLMHTLFAAPLRTILFKVGISNAAIHIVLGLLISFAGPIVAMMILSKIKYMDFIIYPSKYIKIRKKED